MAGGCSIISLCTLCNGELKKMFPSFTSDVAKPLLMMRSCARMSIPNACKFERIFSFVLSGS